MGEAEGEQEKRKVVAKQIKAVVRMEAESGKGPHEKWEKETREKRESV